jgi:hypothetical protein
MVLKLKTYAWCHSRQAAARTLFITGVKYSVVAFYVAKAFLMASHNSRQVSQRNKYYFKLGI